MESRICMSGVVMVLAMAFATGDALKCYECKSVGSANDECKGEILKSMGQKPIDCSLDTMRSWHNKLVTDSTLDRIANVFEVYKGIGMSQNHEPHTPMACVKMDLRVDNQPVTLRTCQTAKTVEVDPCKATREKIAKSHPSTTVEFCDMCETDQCNGSGALSPTVLLAIGTLIGTILVSSA